MFLALCRLAGDNYDDLDQDGRDVTFELDVSTMTEAVDELKYLIRKEYPYDEWERELLSVKVVETIREQDFDLDEFYQAERIAKEEKNRRLKAESAARKAKAKQEKLENAARREKETYLALKAKYETGDKDS